MDWAAFDALTGEQVTAAALTDPDNPPRTREQLAAMRQTPQIKVMRQALQMTQHEFAVSFRIPLETLRNWEEEASKPDPVALAYLRVIAADAEFVKRALADHHGRMPPAGRAAA